MKNLWWITLVFAGSIVFGALSDAYRARAGTGSEGARVATQDTFNLERRISSLEQRIYSIEMGINRLEQQSATNTRTAPSTERRDVELDLLQTPIRTLQGALTEIGCGLAKLDERTLSASVREAQRRSGRLATDPCRLNPDTPLRLSTVR
jgi:predicted RNase H-like nuclease (RuvC/YqgF family)